MADERWPALPFDAWTDTRETLHMWMQIVGKVALAAGPPLNHCWGVALQMTARGLATRVLSHGFRTFTIAFDFIEHALVIDVSDGSRRTLPLEPTTVSAFYRDVMEALESLDLRVRIWTMPVELPPGRAIRFEDDTVHHAYDPEYANRFWRILSATERVLTSARCDFVGKASPAHVFWGSLDLALTRFSGRRAEPPPEGPAFMRDAYSHEVISHGFWPGSDPRGEPAFYAYLAPAQAGFGAGRVRPAAAVFDETLGEFILPYEAVRLASDPDAEVAAFVRSTYRWAADLAGWDRESLEKAP